MSRPPQILALGGGGFSMEAGPLMDDHALALTGVECPRVCFLPTASGDADHYIVRFYRAFDAARCRPSHVSLFRRDGGAGGPLAAHLLAQDLIYVGGGSLISLLGTWRAHGIDGMLRAAWERGVVLAGLSAGSMCWFEQGLTAFHGEDRAVPGLGLLPGSNAVHYDDDARRAAFRAAVADGMPAGHAAENGAALHFAGTELARVVTSRPDARAYRVASGGAETELSGDFLGALALAA